MRTLSLLLALLFLGCSSGTESGNPTRNACTGVRCACVPALIVRVTDSASGAPVGASITVDGQPITCTVGVTGSVCAVDEPRFGAPGAYDVVVSAPGYAATTRGIEISESLSSLCCSCPSQSVALDVALTPDP